MPIKIQTDDTARSEVAWLCDDDWSLPSQVLALEAWLAKNNSTFTKGGHIADIGFSPRPDAAGGGAAISPQMMRALADLGITLFLSEYPPIQDDAGKEDATDLTSQ
jgi:hypothetical protein